MSRLDDELKNMFQRQEPSADFAERVLAQINAEAQPKRSFWQALVSFLQLPTMRWAVAASVILLIAIIGVVQYQRLNQRAITPPQTGVETTTPSDKAVAREQTSPQQQDNGGITQPTGKRANNQNVNQHHQQRPKHIKETSIKNAEAIARQRKAASELAKEQLMKALAIASETVNEAKKVAMGGD